MNRLFTFIATALIFWAGNLTKVKAEIMNKEIQLAPRYFLITKTMIAKDFFVIILRVMLRLLKVKNLWLRYISKKYRWEMIKKLKL